MPDKDVKRCCKRVYGGSFTGHGCANKPKVERGGRWYCATHDPQKVEARRAKREAKWKAEWKLDDERNLAVKKRMLALKRLTDITRALLKHRITDKDWRPRAIKELAAMDEADTKLKEVAEARKEIGSQRSR